ncbi:hypothetical protein ACFVWR_00905 [Leifsonia sp. NPDC058292]|uniref:hypothetical protein n=1 Tax=Leifsonia sp. NPDC058292 TaxID=3346428 RepID=UPI0036D77E1D
MPETTNETTPELTATAVLLLVSDTPASGTAVLIAAPDAPSFVVLGDDTEEGFVRLRTGAIAFGTPETYRAVPRDTVRDGGRVVHVVPDRYRRAEVDRSGSLFGVDGSELWVPVDEHGHPFDRIAVPLPSLEHPLFVTFERADAPDAYSDGPVSYMLRGEATERAGYICQHCGKLCPVKEPHTAAHGVAGHTRTAAQDLDPWRKSPDAGEQPVYEPRA